MPLSQTYPIPCLANLMCANWCIQEIEEIDVSDQTAGKTKARGTTITGLYYGSLALCCPPGGFGCAVCFLFLAQGT